MPALFGCLSKSHPADRMFKAEYEISSETVACRIASSRSDEYGSSENARILTSREHSTQASEFITATTVRTNYQRFAEQVESTGEYDIRNEPHAQ